MKKWTTLDQTIAPDGSTISLHEHDGSYIIRVDGVPLMSTRQHASEERLAELACQHVKNKSAARVLIGGLGLGFTLRAALATLPKSASVVQAELLAAVIAWNRNPAYHLAADAMADARVTVMQQDVGSVIRATRAGFDSIMLDVDNGPAAMVIAGNRTLYDLTGLRQTRAALRPGGCVVYWSLSPDPAFERLMTRAGFQVEVQSCRSHGRSGSRHLLIVGRLV